MRPSRLKVLFPTMALFSVVALMVMKRMWKLNNLQVPGAISFERRLEKRREVLKQQCDLKPRNPSYIEDADFTRFLVIEKLQLVYCFIPKVASTTWKDTLYKAANNGTALTGHVPAVGEHISFLNRYPPSKRKKILDTYYKAMFVREPFARILSAFMDKVLLLNIRALHSIDPSMTEDQLRDLKKTQKLPTPTFPVLVSHILSLKDTGIDMNIHWRSYNLHCPCEVDYDFIGHYENLEEEAPHLLKAIGVDHFVTFPEYHPSNSTPYMVKYYSQLTREDILKLRQLYQFDFKAHGYTIPSPLKRLFNLTRSSV